MNKYLSYYILIIVGFLIAFGTFLKLIGLFQVDSDFFWLLAGVGLGVEGIVTLFKQQTFDRKYKIVLKSELKND